MKKLLLQLPRLATITVILLCPLFNHSLSAQASILNANFSSFNVTPRGMLDISIMNNGADVQIALVAKLYNPKNELVLTVTAKPFIVKKGLNSTAQLNVQVASAAYASGDQAAYIKNSHTLPSGKWRYCADISGVDVSDEFCEENESDFSSFLYLVSPPDKDEIETKYPILVWTHSEPFSLTSQSDYYRVIVTELAKGQSAEGAVNTNIPVYMKNYLSSHQVQYPMDAKELMEGKTYAWQVQRISNGVIVNKTEAWEFNLKQKKAPAENKYGTLKKQVDAAYYTIEDNQLYFKFEEDYKEGNISCAIYNSKREEVKPQANNKWEASKGADYKSAGYNQYQVNLKAYKLSAGYYTLEVKNAKGELFYLRFYTE